MPELVPVRYERMAASPFAFFRGGAAIMAMDLATTPVTGLTVQACGDAHVANFGTFATPERNVVFDINDFDETDRGPWEWDVKRLATSLHVVAREHGFRAPTATTWCSTAVRVLPRVRRRVRGHAHARRLVRPHHRRRRGRALPEALPRPGAARRHPRPAQGPRPGGHQAHRRPSTAGPGSSRTRRSSCTSTSSRRPADDVEAD